MARKFNFGAGPGTLPTSVIEEARDQLLDYQGTGMSIMETSHRAKSYDAVHEEAIANLKELMSLDARHHILFLTGGATMQFAQVPMNLLGPGATADYTYTGAWAKKAIAEARRQGTVHLVADTSKEKPSRMPRLDELKLTPGAAYLHLTTNETIEGTQWKAIPKTDAPLVADMSSDILSRPLDFASFGLIYAGAQKNLGPSGVTLVVVREDLLDRAPESLPEMLRYRVHADNNSLLNTPPTLAIYLVMLVTRWIKAQGGLHALAAVNRDKAARLYAAIDGSDGFYRGTASVESRSDMNVTFRLPTEELEGTFLSGASKAGLLALKGHRSVGGVRASLYNAMPVEGVDALIAFMRQFQASLG